MAKTLVHVANKTHATPSINPNTLNLSNDMQIEVIIPPISLPQPLNYQPLSPKNAENPTKPSEKIPFNPNTEKPKITHDGEPPSFSATTIKSSHNLCTTTPSPGSSPNILDRARSNGEGSITTTQHQQSGEHNINSKSPIPSTTSVRGSSSNNEQLYELHLGK